MVRLVNEAFPCHGVFNIDLQNGYDQVFIFLCIQRKFFAVEDALEQQPASGSASSELQSVLEQNYFLQDISRQVIDEFGDVWRSIEGIQLNTRKVSFALEELKRELVNGSQTDRAWGCACWFWVRYRASQHPKENINRNMAQAAALEAELEMVRLAMEEQVNTLLKDLF